MFATLLYGWLEAASGGYGGGALAAWSMPVVALAAPQLAWLYIICLIVGGGLLAVSLIFGGDHGADTELSTDLHTDLDADVPADVDGGGLDAGGAPADSHHGSLGLSTWISVRFLIYFAAIFGLLGTVLTFTTALSGPTVLAVALAGGLAVGQGVHQVIRALLRSGSDGGATVSDFLNQPARVNVPIEGRERGEVSLEVRGTQRYIAAVASRSDDTLPVGETVVIVGMNSGVAEVLSKKEYDFLREK